MIQSETDTPKAMKKYWTIILFAATIFSSTGCQNDQSNTPSYSELLVSQSPDGKWEANEATLQGIKNMKRFLKQSEERPGTTGLKELLAMEYKSIFKNCTMTGEAHNALHDYLFPLKERIDTLSDPPSAGELKEIREYLEAFDDYFE